MDKRPPPVESGLPGSAPPTLAQHDWLHVRDWPLQDVRKHFGVPEKSAKAIAAGSVTPWEPGGISPFQYQHGRETAERDGWEYDSFGATPPESPPGSPA